MAQKKKTNKPESFAQIKNLLECLLNVHNHLLQGPTSTLPSTPMAAPASSAAGLVALLCTILVDVGLAVPLGGAVFVGRACSICPNFGTLAMLPFALETGDWDGYSTRYDLGFRPIQSAQSNHSWLNRIGNKVKIDFHCNIWLNISNWLPDTWVEAGAP